MIVAIIGAGKIGRALASTFCEDNTIESVLVCDRDGNSLHELEELVNSKKLRTHRVGIEREMAFNAIIRKCDLMISALPSSYNKDLAHIALDAGKHYLDLGGSKKVFEELLQLDEQAQKHHLWVIPNSGFAPGLVNIIAMHGYDAFDKVHSINVRSSGLPQHPVAPFYFQNSFSPAMLLNEYLEDALILREGKCRYVKPLNGYERFKFESHPDLGEYEAFYTSGQITSLAQHLEGCVEELDFKSIRYPGHKDIFQALFYLGFDSNKIIDIKSNFTYRDLLIQQLEKNLPENQKDMVLMKVDINGIKDGSSIQRTYELIEYYDEENDMSSLMKCASIPTLLLTKLIGDKKMVGQGGVKPPEQLPMRQSILDMLKEKGINIDIQERYVQSEKETV